MPNAVVSAPLIEPPAPAVTRDPVESAPFTPPTSPAQAPSGAVARSPERSAVTSPASGDGAGAESSAPRSNGEVGARGAGGAEREARAGQGGSGSGGGVGSGVGARQGSAVALAVPGDGGGDAAEYTGYFALLRSRLQEALRYPTAARRRGLTGTVHVDLEIAPTGAIGNVVLATSSSHRLLDEAALEAVRALERVPFPAGVRPRHLRVRLPVVFDLR
jgi:protein TonB